jgi:hypothetical protein
MRMTQASLWIAALVAVVGMLAVPAVSQDRGPSGRPAAANKAKAKQKATEPTLKRAFDQKAEEASAQKPGEREETVALEQRLAETTAELANFAVGLFYATMGLFVVTASLWLLAYLQSRDMKAAVLAARESSAAARTSAEVAQRGLVLTQRATVVVKEPKAVWLWDEEQGLVGCRLFVTWHNVGSTPTSNMVAAIMGQALEKRPPQDYVVAKGSPRIQPVMAGPNSSVNGSHINIPVELVADIIDHKAHYLLRGWAEYDDVFDNTPRHRVEFCFLVEFEGDLDARKVQALFHIHGKHNRHYDCNAKPPEDEGEPWHRNQQSAIDAEVSAGRSSAHGPLAQS